MLFCSNNQESTIMAIDAYLQIGDIKGESTDEKHRVG